MNARPQDTGMWFFYDLVHKLSSTLDLDAVLTQVIEQVNRYINIDATSVSLLDPDTHELVIRMTVGNSTDPPPGLRLPPYAGIAGWVARHGKSVLVDDAQNDERFYPAVDQLTGFTTRAVICVPLLNNGQTIGVIQALSRSVGTFSKADLHFMNTLADVAALAIENARLYRLAQEARRQTEVMWHVAEALGSATELKEGIVLALEQLRQVVSFDSAAVLAMEHLVALSPPTDERPELRLVAAVGLEKASQGCVLHLSVSSFPLFQRMCVYRRPIYIADAQADGRYICWIGDYPVRSWLGVPLIADEQVVGLVSLDRYLVNEFTTRDIEIAEAFARQVINAISMSRLYRQARARAEGLLLLDEVTAILDGSPSPAEAITRSLEATLRAFDLDAGGVAAPGDDGDWKWAAQVTPEEGMWLRPEQVETGLRQEGSSQVIAVPLPGSATPQVWSAIVPLFVRGDLAGALVVQSTERERLSGPRLEALTTLGRILGIILGDALPHARPRAVIAGDHPALP